MVSSCDCDSVVGGGTIFGKLYQIYNFSIILKSNVLMICRRMHLGQISSEVYVTRVFVLRYITSPQAHNKLQRSTLQGLSQITPGPRTASKNGYFGHFRTVPVRLPSDSAGAGTIFRARTGAGVSKTLLPILPAFYSNR